MRRALRSTLFPYTTLFRSGQIEIALADTQTAGPVIGRHIVFGGHGFAAAVHHVTAAGGEAMPPEYDVAPDRSEEHTSELQSRPHLVCRPLLEKKKTVIW